MPLYRQGAETIEDFHTLFRYITPNSAEPNAERHFRNNGTAICQKPRRVGGPLECLVRNNGSVCIRNNLFRNNRLGVGISGGGLRYLSE